MTRKPDLAAPPVALAGGLLGASEQLRRGIAETGGVELGTLAYVEELARAALGIARQLATE